MEENKRKIESEKALEARLRQEVEKLGGLALKYTSQYHRGIPDRIVLLPTGLIYFVEMKTTGQRPTVLQKNAMAKLGGLGFRSFVIDCTESLDAFIAQCTDDLAHSPAPMYFAGSPMTVHLR